MTAESSRIYGGIVSRARVGKTVIGDVTFTRNFESFYSNMRPRSGCNSTSKTNHLFILVFSTVARIYHLTTPTREHTHAYTLTTFACVMSRQKHTLARCTKTRVCPNIRPESETVDPDCRRCVLWSTIDEMVNYNTVGFPLVRGVMGRARTSSYT